jgi:alkylation response protein AidB-like acyl-CoA dehydrogenase
MDFSLTEEQQLLVDSIRKFAVGELTEPAVKYRDQLIPKDILHDLFRKISDFGILGWCVPEEDGGPGLDCFTTIVMVEELFKVFPSLAAACCSTGQPGASIKGSGVIRSVRWRSTTPRRRG